MTANHLERVGHCGKVDGCEINYPNRSIRFKRAKVSLYLIKHHVMIA
jgi:hypothetical protein